jgi:hypothetical protein
MDSEVQEFKLKTALVCIAKNEDNYIEEWVNYHIKLGFDMIFIYENNWRCKLDHPQIVKIPFDGEVKQVSAYNNFVKIHGNDFDWIGFIDIDEFLVLNKDENVNDFFKRFNHMSGVAVNWVIFGDNGLDEVIDNEYSVLKRFTKRQSETNIHIKSFINMKKSKNFFMLVHNPNMKISNQSFQLFEGPFCNNCSTEFAQLNHYFCKTFEEFKEKADRGRADSPKNRNYDEFHHLNFNEVEDLTAYNFIYK